MAKTQQLSPSDFSDAAARHRPTMLKLGSGQTHFEDKLSPGRTPFSGYSRMPSAMGKSGNPPEKLHEFATQELHVELMSAIGCLNNQIDKQMRNNDLDFLAAYRVSNFVVKKNSNLYFL